jgi:biotin carboxylase
LNFQMGLSLGSTLIDPASELSERMKAELVRVVQALPALPVLTFHAEFFLTPGDEIVFCEVAARTGGGRIVESVERAYGVNLNRTWVRWQCGLPDELDLHPFEPSGWLLVSSRTSGRVVGIPDRIPFEWTAQYWPGKKPGDTISSAVSTSNVDGLATMVVRGADPAAVERRLQELDDWFLRSLVVEAEPARV